MRDFDYKWILSILVSVIGVVLPIALNSISTPEKIITFDVVSKSTLVGPLGSIEGLEITMNSKPIKEAYIYLLKLTNAGTEPIAVRDYEKPIQIEFEGEIVSVKDAGKLPTNLSLNFSVSNSEISISPFLLNPKEEFSLEVVSTTPNYPTVQSRIAGITKIEGSYPDDKTDIKKIINLTSAFFLLVFYAKYIYPFLIFRRQKNKSKTDLILALSCGAASGLLIASVMKPDLEDWFFWIYIAVPTAIGTALSVLESYEKV